MLYYVIVFAILALLTGVLGFGGAQRHSRLDRQGPADGLSGPVRAVADIQREEKNGSLIRVGGTRSSHG